MRVFKTLFLIYGLVLIAASAKAEILEWAATTDATAYEVYVRTAGQTEAGYRYVGTTTATTFEVSPETTTRTYEYSIRAIDDCNNISDFSDPVALRACGTPKRIEKVRVTITVDTTP